MQQQSSIKEPRAWMIAWLGAALAYVFAMMPVHAQSIVCCSQNIGVGGSWVGSSRLADCQEFFNSAPTSILRRMCQQRDSLSCINTARCSELPPEDGGPQESPNSSTALPPDPDRDGLEQGFYGPPAAEPPAAPAHPPMPHRLVYLIMGAPGEKRPATSFMVWLDRGACPLALDHNNRLADSTAARHVVRGRVIRRDGRVHVEAEAQERPGGAKLGPFTGDAPGEDAAAVAKATRVMTKKMKLVCAR